MNVDVGGFTVFDHRREWGRDIGRPDAPTVHVRTIGLFGTVDIWRVPHDMRGAAGETLGRGFGRPSTMMLPCQVA